MKKINLIIILLLISGMHELSAQSKKWTLGDCITYAIENNIGLKRQELQTESAKADRAKASLDFLPSLNFGSDAVVGFGRSIDPVTNLITFKENVSNAYSLNTSITLFSGFTAMNTLTASRFMVKAGLETEKVARNTLVINILGAYYRVLYMKGLENAAGMQFEQSEKQLFRITKMVENGKEALSKQYEMESRASEDRLSYTIAKNNTNQALTAMRQMLQLEPGTEFDLTVPELETPLTADSGFRTDSIYNIASQTLPRLKAINFELMAARKQVAAAWGDIAPKISAGGSIYTGFYKVLGDEGAGQDPFSQQLKNNSSQAVSLSLRIPLFNNYSIGRNIRLAKLRKQDAELRLQLEKNALYTDIENACLDYNRGKDEYEAAASNLGFNKKSFEAVEKKFENGLIDVIDYGAAKTTLFRAESEELRTRLQVMIRKLTIGFYTTGEYEKIINN
jgi:outer membrane protein